MFLFSGVFEREKTLLAEGQEAFSEMERLPSHRRPHRGRPCPARSHDGASHVFPGIICLRDHSGPSLLKRALFLFT